jgi:hypothetical protein
VEYGPDVEVISSGTIERALDLADLLIPHAQAAFSLMGADEATVDAKYVAQRVKSKGPVHRLKQSEIYRDCDGRIPRVDRLQKALTVLIERNIISEPYTEQTGGRPSIYFYVNPEFWGEQR